MPWWQILIIIGAILFYTPPIYKIIWFVILTIYKPFYIQKKKKINNTDTKCKEKVHWDYGFDYCKKCKIKYCKIDWCDCNFQKCNHKKVRV